MKNSLATPHVHVCLCTLNAFMLSCNLPLMNCERFMMVLLPPHTFLLCTSFFLRLPHSLSLSGNFFARRRSNMEVTKKENLWHHTQINLFLSFALFFRYYLWSTHKDNLLNISFLPFTFDCCCCCSFIPSWHAIQNENKRETRGSR